MMPEEAIGEGGPEGIRALLCGGGIVCGLNITDDVAVEGAAGAMEAAADGILGDALAELATYISVVLVEQKRLARTARADGTAEPFALGAYACKRLAGALRNKVTFDLGRQSEGEREHLGLDVFAKPIVVLDRPDTTTAMEAIAEDLHDHIQAASEAAEFGADDEIALSHPTEQGTQPSLVVSHCSRDCFLDPSVDADVIFLTKTRYFKALVLDRLLVGRDANIPIVHNTIFCTKIQKNYEKICT